jgi:predicted P-loop ATPase/GTPase
MQTQKFTLSSEQKMSPEEQHPAAERPQPKDDMQMNTTNTLMAAPMVRIHPRAATPMRRPSVDEALALARIEHEDWFWLFESHSNLAVPGAVDLQLAAELIESAPTDFLAGVVTGMALNN